MILGNKSATYVAPSAGTYTFEVYDMAGNKTIKTVSVS